MSPLSVWGFWMGILSQSDNLFPVVCDPPKLSASLQNLILLDLISLVREKLN